MTARHCDSIFRYQTPEPIGMGGPLRARLCTRPALSVRVSRYLPYMTDRDRDAELAEAKAELKAAVAALPEELRSALPTDEHGEPRAELVWALFRYEHPGPREVKWVQVRELTMEEFDAAVEAHGEVYRVTHSYDRFLTFAWHDLQEAIAALDAQLNDRGLIDGDTVPLLEYRLVVFSTALKMYGEYVTAHVNRTNDPALKQNVRSAFSELYDRSFGYRLIYAMRNAVQHGVGSLIRFEGRARLVGDSDTEVESESHIYLQKDVFGASKAKAVVRQQVRELDDDLDLIPLCRDAYSGVQELHARLIPMLHQGVPSAVRLLRQYIDEVGRESAHFHEYVRGLPAKGVLETLTLDREGFAYVIGETGGRVV